MKYDTLERLKRRFSGGCRLKCDSRGSEEESGDVVEYLV
jgi:hypothetical protein